MSPRITLIGAGHMGGALLSGLMKKSHPAEKLRLSDPSAEKREAFKKKYGVFTSADNQAAVKTAEVVIFAVKPQQLPEVAKELAAVIQAEKPLVISLAAGVREKSLAGWLGKETAIVRCMPNTPALIGCGATALYSNANTAQEQRRIAEAILAAVGTTVWVEDEKQMDVVTALSGSGPAYFFLLMEAMEQAAQELGLSKDCAHSLCLQTGVGATRLALESENSLAALRKQVTSPGGTTEAAIEILEKGELRALMKKTLQAAQKRAEDLAKAAD